MPAISSFLERLRWRVRKSIVSTPQPSVAQYNDFPSRFKSKAGLRARPWYKTGALRHGIQDDFSGQFHDLAGKIDHATMLGIDFERLFGWAMDAHLLQDLQGGSLKLVQAAHLPVFRRGKPG